MPTELLQFAVVYSLLNFFSTNSRVSVELKPDILEISSVIFIIADVVNGRMSADILVCQFIATSY
jgi:hypothetical protein